MSLGTEVFPEEDWVKICFMKYYARCGLSCFGPIFGLKARVGAGDMGGKGN